MKMKLTDRARGRVTALALAGMSALLAGCNAKEELLAPQQPGVITPGSVTNATAADALLPRPFTLNKPRELQGLRAGIVSR